MRAFCLLIVLGLLCFGQARKWVYEDLLKRVPEAKFLGVLYGPDSFAANLDGKFIEVEVVTITLRKGTPIAEARFRAADGTEIEFIVPEVRLARVGGNEK